MLQLINIANAHYAMQFSLDTSRCRILRDNLPPALEYSTSREELALIADSIESKLYQTAPSARAYKAFSTLEFRITALATAVLIYSDKGNEDRLDRRWRQLGISDTCARLSAAARKSLVHCVMVLLSYEKQNLEKHQQQAMMETTICCTGMDVPRGKNSLQSNANIRYVLYVCHYPWILQVRAVFSTPIPALTGTHTGTKHNFGLYIVLNLRPSNLSGMHV